jgi:DNA-binding FrmR family transcriptional regulator
VYEERNKEDLEKRLKRIEGQVRDIYRMIEEDRYCIDILNQIIAARAALSKVGTVLLKSHLRRCVTSAIKEERSEQAIDELMDVLTKFVR